MSFINGSIVSYQGASCGSIVNVVQQVPYFMGGLAVTGQSNADFSNVDPLIDQANGVFVIYAGVVVPYQGQNPSLAGVINLQIINLIVTGVAAAPVEFTLTIENVPVPLDQSLPPGRLFMLTGLTDGQIYRGFLSAASATQVTISMDIIGAPAQSYSSMVVPMIIAKTEVPP